MSVLCPFLFSLSIGILGNSRKQERIIDFYGNTKVGRPEYLTNAPHDLALLLLTLDGISDTLSWCKSLKCSLFPQTIKDWNDLPDPLISSAEISDEYVSKLASLARARD